MPNGLLEIRVEIAGEVQLSRKLRGYLDGIRDTKGMFEALRGLWIDNIRKNFSRQATGGDPWAPLSERYAAWKNAHYPGTRILYRTGAMYRAATEPATEITEHSMTLTVESEYAIYHQSPLPRKRLPRRPFASLSGDAKTAWVRVIREHLLSEEPAST